MIAFNSLHSAEGIDITLSLSLLHSALADRLADSVFVKLILRPVVKISRLWPDDFKFKFSLKFLTAFSTVLLATLRRSCVYALEAILACLRS